MSNERLKAMVAVTRRKPIVVGKENKALSSFLLAYSSSIRKETISIKRHMDFDGYPYYPSWVENAKQGDILFFPQTQEWIKYLINLENIKELPPGHTEC